MLILSPTNYKPHPSNTKLINLHKIPNSSISLKPYENKTHHTLHLSYTPALSRKNSNFIPKLECSNFNLNLLKPTRHISLNYEKRDKYISQTKSFILKKIFREKQSQDHNLQFLSRNLEYENELYRGEEIHTEKQSPYSVALSLRNSCEKHNKTFKNKSPLTFKLTRIENFKISDRIKEVQLEEKEKENMGIYSSEISNNNHEEIKENNLEIDIENKKKFNSPFTLKEKRILDYLDKEHIVWVPMVDKKEESQEKKKFEILMANKANIGAGKSDLLERRKFLVPKVKLSSSCDNLTDLLQAEQVIEET